MTYGELFCLGKERLFQAGVQDAGMDAVLLLEHVCGTTRSDLRAHGDREVEPGQAAAYEALLSRREERIPLQLLTGVQEFMGLEFSVNEKVLVPRQDTEILVEEVLRELFDGMRILDLCTGSGCILISLLHYSNDCEGLGVDISTEALKTAAENAFRLLGGEHGLSQEENTAGMDGPGRRYDFRQGDLFEAAEGKFDIIVSNPPYIPSAVIGTLMPEVREHEPRLALDGGQDGLDFYRRILEGSGEYLNAGGKLFLEIGYDQAEAVGRLMEQAGFQEIRTKKDYAGHDRVVWGTLGFPGP